MGQQAPLPRIVSVVGLSKSGKTTVAEALLRELGSRGLRVGAVKTSSHERLELDPEGTDTRRLAEAGAGVVVAALPHGTVRFERTARGPTRQDIGSLFPPGTDVVVYEGTLPGAAGVLGCLIVCITAAAELERTLEVRGLAQARIDVVSGIGASGALPGEKLSWRGAELPLLDALSPAGRRELADLAMRGASGLQPSTPEE